MEEKIHAGAHENQKINFHRPNLNVKCFQLHIVRAEKPKLNDHKFESFCFFFEFAKNEGRSDPCPNTLIWSGLSRKHVFTASNRNIIKNRVEKKKLEQILSKSYRFFIQTLICIIIFHKL